MRDPTPVEDARAGKGGSRTLDPGVEMMNFYRVELWFMQGHVSGLPTIDVEAGSEMEAAALGFKHFRSSGQRLQLSEWKVSVKELPDGVARSYHRDVVIAWLHAPPQRRFVEDHACASGDSTTGRGAALGVGVFRRVREALGALDANSTARAAPVD